MKNLIIQHFEPFREDAIEQMKRTGKSLPYIVEHSVNNIRAYAEHVGAEYKLLDGEPFQSGLRGQCQKCCAINEEYDDYDVVVVLDTDKFMTKKGWDQNIFEAEGIACFDDIHRKTILPKFCHEFPRISNMDYPIWSGACYVMPREFRQLMRKQINPAMRKVFEAISPRPYVDEGIFHVLCHKAKFKLDKYLDERWDYSSYLPDPQDAYMLHIRHKPKTREENYRDLLEAGIIYNG